MLLKGRLTIGIALINIYLIMYNFYNIGIFKCLYNRAWRTKYEIYLQLKIES
jgi:hypothetical protein